MYKIPLREETIRRLDIADAIAWQLHKHSEFIIDGYEVSIPILFACAIESDQEAIDDGFDYYLSLCDGEVALSVWAEATFAAWNWRTSDWRLAKYTEDEIEEVKAQCNEWAKSGIAISRQRNA